MTTRVLPMPSQQSQSPVGTRQRGTVLLVAMACICLGGAIPCSARAPASIAQAMLFIDLGEDRYAIEELSLLLEKSPDDAHVLGLLGAVHARQGEWPLAVRHLTRAVALEPTWVDIRVRLGRAHYEIENWNLAEYHLSRAANYTKDDSQARELLAATYENQGRWEAASREYDRLIGEFGPAPRWSHRAGLVASRTGQRSHAIHLLEAAIREDRTGEIGRRARADLDAMLNQWFSVSGGASFTYETAVVARDGDLIVEDELGVREQANGSTQHWALMQLVPLQGSGWSTTLDLAYQRQIYNTLNEFDRERQLVRIGGTRAFGAVAAGLHYAHARLLFDGDPQSSTNEVGVDLSYSFTETSRTTLAYDRSWIEHVRGIKPDSTQSSARFIHVQSLPGENWLRGTYQLTFENDDQELANVQGRDLRQQLFSGELGVNLAKDFEAVLYASLTLIEFRGLEIDGRGVTERRRNGGIKLRAPAFSSLGKLVASYNYEATDHTDSSVQFTQNRLTLAFEFALGAGDFRRLNEEPW